MGRSHPTLHTCLDAADSRRPTAAGRAAKAGEWRMAACALALATALAAMSTVRSPGDRLKADLQAAGAAIRELGINRPPDHVQKIVAALFSANAVEVDATRFPGRVVVTLRALDRITCLTASAAARRIEGRVVIELRGFASPGDCGERNDMAWLILP